MSAGIWWAATVACVIPLVGCTSDTREADESESSAPSIHVADATSAIESRTAGHASPSVETDKGVVRGIKTATTRRFLGIPYAAAPVGGLRWQPPQPHARWHGPLDATQFAAHCPQIPSPFGEASITEDCLFLNVFTPPAAHPHARLPVMVWIHGGFFALGESDAFDPTALVEHGDVVVVTINYRLGELGFLAHPALTAESPDHASGNYGLMDQQAALGWVQRNIASFGGDPHRVTIFGQSAGANSVHTHLASPLAAGMFARAIVQSGAYSLTEPTLAVAEAAGAAFATRAGCTDQTATCLRALPVTSILANERAVTEFRPNIDGRVLTQSTGAAFASGAFQRVPIIEGSNHDEWRMFTALSFDLVGGPLTADGYPAAVQATLGIPAAFVPFFTAEYPLSAYASPDLAISAMGTDAVFACNARYVDGLLSQFVPTYAYEFADETAPPLLPPVSFPYGAAHAAELPYLFGLGAVPIPLTPPQRQLSDAMIRYWTTFARTGQPSSHASHGSHGSHATVAWPRFECDGMLSLVAPTPTVVTEASFAADHKCAFWDALRQ